VQESNGLTYDYEDKDPENWLKTDFPARYIYEKVSMLKVLVYFLGSSDAIIRPAFARSCRCREPTRALPPWLALGRRPKDFEPNSGGHSPVEWCVNVSNLSHST
jgi:hypothetical protein